MKKGTVSMFRISLLLAMLALLLTASVAFAGGHNTETHKISGGGWIDRSSSPFFEDTQIGFYAKTNKHGIASGQVQIHILNGATFHAVVDCVSVAGNKAWIAAELTKSDSANPLFAVGKHFVFEVEDNGEGSNAPADRFSGVYPGEYVAPCTDQQDLFSFYVFFWENGNVQVH